MSNSLFEVVLSQGIWTILSFFLIFYIIKNQERRDKIQEKRETKYQQIISELNQNFELIHTNIQEIKNNLK